MLAPGDVILVDFPGAHRTKVRPGVVVSSAAYLATRPDVVVGLCTSKVAGALTATDYELRDWAAAGLHSPTAYRSYFTTTEQWRVHLLIGRLTDRDWAVVQARLRLAIAI